MLEKLFTLLSTSLYKLYGLRRSHHWCCVYSWEYWHG